MQFEQLRHTTTFRITLLYGALFAVGTIALLWMVYVRSAVYLTRRVDSILDTEADALLHTPRPELRQRVIEELTLNGGRNNVFGLFDTRGERIVGNLAALPPSLPADGRPVEFPPSAGFPASARLMARHLPTGETLVVGRDVSQLQELRSIITSALLWSGVSILVVGLACGTALSIRPLQRLRRLQAAAYDIARGNLQGRMPTGPRGDELDLFADTVNHMVGEVDRLMSEVRGATSAIAHDLLGPLANAAVQLRGLQRASTVDPDSIARVTDRIEEVLDRFRAILRIAELEAGQRRAGFRRMDLAEVADPVVELYAPLAEAAGVRLGQRCV